MFLQLDLHIKIVTDVPQVGDVFDLLITSASTVSVEVCLRVESGAKLRNGKHRLQFALPRGPVLHIDE